MITVLILGFALSTIIVFLLCVYIKWLWNKFNLLTKEVPELYSSIAEYYNHVKSLYNSERYSGDIPLKRLMHHSKQLMEFISSYELTNVFSDITKGGDEIDAELSDRPAKPNMREIERQTNEDWEKEKQDSSDSATD